MTLLKELWQLNERKLPTKPKVKPYRASQDLEAETKKVDKNAPYLVGWMGQSYEWYGDDDMKKGRYKPKGGDDTVVAINVKDKLDAEAIADKLDKEKPSTGKHGDHYYVDYLNSYIKPMKKASREDKTSIKSDKPKDYKNK